jgi:hypothetical protein
METVMPLRSRTWPALWLLALILPAGMSLPATGANYEVGPGRMYAELGDVPWQSLAAGDTVLVYARTAAYNHKFVLCVAGTQSAPVTVRGVPDALGNLPLIDGNGAVTPAPLNFWNEDRGVIKIGGANVPSDTTPEWIVLENLEVRSARPAYSYTGDDAATHAYLDNAAAVYIEKGRNITVRNCILHDCGNGLFCAWQTRDLLVEGCYIYDNGIASSIYQHNNYTEAHGIVFQFNRFGPLRAGCPGNNLKDRSAGCVIRCNWIEGGNRQLDLVDSANLNSEPEYGATFVYGNVLIEPDGAGNSQILHYGGDGGSTATYRKGILYFHNNTVISHRAGNTTLMRLSTNDETCDCRNNIIYVTASGDRLAITNSAGTVDLRNNWFKVGWVHTHNTLTGLVNNLGGHVEGSLPGFVDFSGQDFHLALSTSLCIDAGGALSPAASASHTPLSQYVPHRSSELRPVDGILDIGAFEVADPCPEGG